MIGLWPSPVQQPWFDDGWRLIESDNVPLSISRLITGGWISVLITQFFAVLANQFCDKHNFDCLLTLA
jgi:hypothetical protein